MAKPKDPLAGHAPTQASSASTTDPDPYGLGQDWINVPLLLGGAPGFQGTIGGLISAGDAMDQFNHLRGSNLAQIQQAMYLGGFYSGNYTPTLGVLHQQDMTAFKDALKIAAGSGSPLANFLKDAAQSGQDQGTKQQHNYEQLTHTLQTTDPNTIGLTLEKAFEDAIGKKPTAAQSSRFVASFRARETSSQQQVFSAQDAARQAYINRDVSGADSSGAVSQTVNVTQPDLQADAITEARTANPNEYGAHEIANQGAAFYNLLRGAIG